mmetsp:Transcript_11872/g.21787  ORF Transcript_11872/g.21787 Transcript_11872/m.21787 type:complete len:203 (+) Transcript_11872:361-969(+)
MVAMEDTTTGTAEAGEDTTTEAITTTTTTLMARGTVGAKEVKERGKVAKVKVRKVMVEKGTTAMATVEKVRMAEMITVPKAGMAKAKAKVKATMRRAALAEVGRVKAKARVEARAAAVARRRPQTLTSWVGRFSWVTCRGRPRRRTSRSTLLQLARWSRHRSTATAMDAPVATALCCSRQRRRQRRLFSRRMIRSCRVVRSL